ncbi:hypothetical protein Tco_0608207 [Tanacetum coccineum]
MKMVLYEAFACRCRAIDVVLRESYKPKTRGKLYYACPLSKHRESYFYFYGKRRIRVVYWSQSVLLVLQHLHAILEVLHRLQFILRGSSSTSNLLPGSSTLHVSQELNLKRYYRETSRNAECSNCKHLLGKIKVLDGNRWNGICT